MGILIMGFNMEEILVELFVVMVGNIPYKESPKI
jgi:hypothetical protein